MSKLVTQLTKQELTSCTGVRGTASLSKSDLMQNQQCDNLNYVIFSWGAAADLLLNSKCILFCCILRKTGENSHSVTFSEKLEGTFIV